MAAFCGTCGKPLAAGASFCGACGAQANATPANATPANATPANAAPASAMPPPAASVNSAAPVKSGSSALKIVLVVVLLGGAGLVAAAGAAFYYGRNRLAAWRNGSSSTASSTGSSMPFSAMARAMERHASAAAFGQAALLSKEEVGSIIGVPVTSIEMSGKSDATYKTEKVGLEASIEIERKNGDADAIQSMDGARQVTRQAFGGKAEKVDGIGDEALYGAFNVLYVRKNDVFLTIMPPNLQMAAQQEQASKMFAQPLGSDAQVKELEKLKETMKNDPVKDSLAKPDAVSGAAGLIHSAAAERGGEYETRSRLMARQMAEKVLAKIGT